MIHTASGLPQMVMSRYPTFLSRPNEVLLVPWRTSGIVLHIAGLVTVADYRKTLIVTSSLGPLYEESDYDYMLNLADGAVVASVLCLVLTTLGFLSGRSIQIHVVNLIHAVCHTLAGVLFMCIWAYDSHVMRMWHVWYFFGLVPAVLEVAVVGASYYRGAVMW
jgi:hypothetical protein